jgi:hypothetical protein
MGRGIKTRETVIGIDEPCDEGNDIIIPSGKVLEIGENETAGLLWLCFRKNRDSDDEH